MKVIKFAPGLIPVFKHQDHDQKTHGNWANSWATGARNTPDDKWLIDNFGDKTTFTRNDPKGLLRFSVPNSLIDDPRYQESIQLSLDTLEKLQDSYPLTTQVDFVEGGKTQGGFLGETFSASVDGVPAPSKIILTEDLLKPNAEKDLLVHTITHEWGHAQDWRTPEKAKEQGARFSQAKFEDDDIPMTDYGWSNDREAYAEAFAIKFNGSHKGGVWSANVEQTDKWEEVFKIFELDSVKKAKGERVSFLVKDTFDANNPPVLIENYAPPVLKHEEHDQSTHGNWAKGGNGLGIEAVERLRKSSDPLKEKVYEAEKSVARASVNTLEKPTAPKFSDFPSRADYDKAYREYSKKWTAWAVEKQASILSELGEKLLDGTPSGVKKYVNDVIKQDWFIETFGDGKSLPPLDVTTANTVAAGRHILGVTRYRGTGRIIAVKHEISIDRQFTKNEEVILHEISHYATTISETDSHFDHGTEFARNHVFISSKVAGSARAQELENAYKEKGVKNEG
jgi:predicted SprT family Zn-dependent metalloprotease